MLIPFREPLSSRIPIVLRPSSSPSRQPTFLFRILPLILNSILSLRSVFGFPLSVPIDRFPLDSLQIHSQPPLENLWCSF